MLLVNKQNQKMTTIEKTLLTAKLMDGFWERWLVHGVEKEALQTVRSSISTYEQWINSWEKHAVKKLLEAEKFKKYYKNAEMNFRIAALYYQLNQWLIPENTKDKRHWLNVSLLAVKQADQISGIETWYDQIEIKNNKCFGRIRTVPNAKGVVVIINPIDSTKEELFKYEMDFVNNGYTTVSFDGPGQGQTFTFHGFKASVENWQKFIDTIIDYSFSLFPELPIYLFGTSSGASWAVYGSCNAKVSKVVAVSPAFKNETIRLPDYFTERTSYVLEKGANHMLPTFENMRFRNPVLLVHGKRDVMVSDQNIYTLYARLPNGKYLMEYEDEGHCCNYQLSNIRQISVEWFREGF